MRVRESYKKTCIYRDSEGIKRYHNESVVMTWGIFSLCALLDELKKKELK